MVILKCLSLLQELIELQNGTEQVSLICFDANEEVS
jgi:hypothetical protein